MGTKPAAALVIDAIRKLENIIEVYDDAPEGWFTIGQYRGVVHTSLTAAQNRLDKAVREGRAERRMIRLTGRRPCWIYRATVNPAARAKS